MRIRTSSKSGLFLLEFMIIFIIFGLTTVVCLGFFIKAHEASTYSKDLTLGTMVAMTVAEEFKGGEKIEATSFYNEDGKKIKNGNYRVDFRETSAENLQAATITVSKGGKNIYNLGVKYCRDGDVRE